MKPIPEDLAALLAHQSFLEAYEIEELTKVYTYIQVDRDKFYNNKIQPVCTSEGQIIMQAMSVHEAVFKYSSGEIFLPEEVLSDNRDAIRVVEEDFFS